MTEEDTLEDSFENHFERLNAQNAFNPKILQYDGLEGSVIFIGKDFSALSEGTIFAEEPTSQRGIRIIVNKRRDYASRFELVTGDTNYKFNCSKIQHPSNKGATYRFVFRYEDKRLRVDIDRNQ